MIKPLCFNQIPIGSAITQSSKIICIRKDLLKEPQLSILDLGIKTQRTVSIILSSCHFLTEKFYIMCGAHLRRKPQAQGGVTWWCAKAHHTNLRFNTKPDSTYDLYQKCDLNQTVCNFLVNRNQVRCPAPTPPGRGGNLQGKIIAPGSKYSSLSFANDFLDPLSFLWNPSFFLSLIRAPF